ncbi:hypothetical protein VNO77_39286 [Canavalia gladiata]|uniref:Uncharacterized protein n=1 Tax=Canavalia gladiata TaxID=3824 RepID=A0AAN9KDE5_CANGL
MTLAKEGYKRLFRRIGRGLFAENRIENTKGKLVSDFLGGNLRNFSRKQEHSSKLQERNHALVPLNWSQIFHRSGRNLWLGVDLVLFTIHHNFSGNFLTKSLTCSRVSAEIENIEFPERRIRLLSFDSLVCGRSLTSTLLESLSHLIRSAFVTELVVRIQRPENNSQHQIAAFHLALNDSRNKKNLQAKLEFCYWAEFLLSLRQTVVCSKSAVPRPNMVAELRQQQLDIGISKVPGCRKCQRIHPDPE